MKGAAREKYATKASAMKVLLLLLFSLFNSSGAYGEEFHRWKRHFVLVHGSGHGAWCWYKVAALLRQAGHEVDALDLLGAGINTVEAKNVLTLEQYSSPVLKLFSALASGDKVVLVGHSLGGATLTFLLENFPQQILAAVYVAGLMLPSGPDASTINNQLLAMTLESARTHTLEELFYGLSPPEDKILGKSLFKATPAVDPTVNFTAARYGSVPRYYVKTLQDRVIAPEEQDFLIRKTPPTGVLELKSDHSPFFSRPQQLVSGLLNFARMQNS